MSAGRPFTKAFALLIGAALIPGCSGQPQRTFGTVTVVVVNNALPSETEALLVRRLSDHLTVGVAARRMDTTLPGYDVARQQLAADRVLADEGVFVGQGSDEYRVVLVPIDIYEGQGNFLFAYTDPGRRRTVVSTWRLATLNPNVAKAPPEQLVDRVYKLLLRRVGVMAGLRSTGCAMGFANSVDELDRVPDDYCPDDRQSLKKAGLLR